MLPMQPLRRDGHGLLLMEQVLDRNDINKPWCSYLPGDIYLGGLLMSPCDSFFENGVQDTSNEHFMVCWCWEQTQCKLERLICLQAVADSRTSSCGCVTRTPFLVLPLPRWEQMDPMKNTC